MPHSIALITDSTSDLPAEWIQQYEIDIVPLTLIFGDQQYLDRVEITPEEFYRRLPTERGHPTTSQPTPKQFLDAYQRAAEKGAREIITITISAAMSGTIISARQAAAESPVPVHAVDGKNNSMGLGWQVIAAARSRDSGGGVQEMLSAAQQVREDMLYYVTLDTIEYLSKGGRIADASRFLSSFLQIKPLIYVKPESGSVGASFPARSRKAGLDGLYKEFFRRMPSGRPMHLTILHNNAEEEAQELAERVRQENQPEELFVTITSPVLGAHTGPGAVALLGYAERA